MEQEEIAAEDGRMTLSKPESGGLVIGMLGGASNYMTGTGAVSTITGSYTKLLLLEPNTSRTTAQDNISRKWSDNTTTQLQLETRKYWDPTYTSTHIEKASGYAYDYCYNLTLGGVDKGSWYLPTQAQLMAMRAVQRGLQENSSFTNYSAFSNTYWCSTENIATEACYVSFFYGYAGANFGKTPTHQVRCVRDATSSLPAQMVTTVGAYPVIDLSAWSPLGAVLPFAEAAARRTEMNAQTPTNDASLSIGNDQNGVWNAKLSTTFQVMRADRSAGTDFANAWALCKAYDGEGGAAGSWRLPTQRELLMIWVLHPQLIGKGGITSFTSYYWTATEFSEARAWCVSLGNGNITDKAKTDSYHVRCVRDL